MRIKERIKDFAKVLLAAVLGAVAVMILYLAFLLALGVSMAQLGIGW